MSAGNVFRWTREAGILVTANYMIGLPGETKVDLEKTVLFDVVSDPLETHDLIESDRGKRKVEELRKRLNEWWDPEW